VSGFGQPGHTNETRPSRLSYRRSGTAASTRADQSGTVPPASGPLRPQEFAARSPGDLRWFPQEVAGCPAMRSLRGSRFAVCGGLPTPTYGGGRRSAHPLLADGWHNAVPVLANLAPDVVISIRDVVFQHLGLED
jgi:hypothetical protein